jgi:hypothetical protein
MSGFLEARKQRHRREAAGDRFYSGSVIGWNGELHPSNPLKPEEAVMPFDYTDVPPPSFDLIPDGTVATVSIHIRPGNVGEDGLLKRNKAGDAEMLDTEYTVIDGPHKGRKFWNNLLLAGTTDGQKKMAAGNLGVLKAVLDSALGLKPNDVSAEARAARTVSVKKFEGMWLYRQDRRGEGRPQERR